MNATNRTATQLAELRTLLGADAVLPGDSAGDAVLLDQRKLHRGHPLAVVLPRSTEEVARLVGWCQANRVGIVPQGGNTSYCGGATPDGSGTQLVVAMRRMRAVRAVDARNYSLIAEAGCVLAEVQAAALAVDRYFPLSLGSEGSCQIGGNLATNAGGLNVLRYGMARASVLGIEAVLPDGSVWHGLKTLRKDNTGYDLNALFVGSEGTLGIITAAALRLQPLPVSTATAMVAVPSADAAVALLAHLRAATGDQLSSLEYMPQPVVDLTCELVPGVRAPLQGRYGACVLAELGTAGGADDMLLAALGSAVDAGIASDAVLAQNQQQRADFWRLRESIPEAQQRLGASLKYDVSVPFTALPEFLQRVTRWVEEHVPEGLLVCYGHLGDGNLHCNVGQRRGTERGAFLARETEISEFVLGLAHSLDGSISAEHGIGQLKRAALQRYAAPEKLAIMRAIKSALDPAGIMNPGKLL